MTNSGVMRVKKTRTAKAKPLVDTSKREDKRKQRNTGYPVGTPFMDGNN